MNRNTHIRAHTHTHPLLAVYIFPRLSATGSFLQPAGEPAVGFCIGANLKCLFESCQSCWVFCFSFSVTRESYNNHQRLQSNKVNSHPVFHCVLLTLHSIKCWKSPKRCESLIQEQTCTSSTVRVSGRRETQCVVFRCIQGLWGWL